ncbi:CoA pyrophosphatase [Rhodospirillaceae bacterium KN72]|uniref:CoA pyrophosphatase n=1 Tax=Pacificispira spongiicola TaxID=2729598 RepID=A0A7Y0E0W5_9PROT|nr:CoA pyrophosphatase [Pacificispira spongiicola]NMM45199.1 CoA pyrophosphatase [Pacificispira spongiicola]
MMDFAEIERRILGAAVPTRRGDDDLNPGMRPMRDDLIPASVLIPLVQRPEGTTMLLTKRTPHMKDHAGQIAFPGGRRDPEDTDDIATALRETQEEVGIGAGSIRILGSIAPYVTRTGYAVTPFVGAVDPDIAPRPDPFEVDEIFEVPFAFLLDRANHQRHSHTINGTDRHFYAMPYGEYFIWGATAGMIVNLVDILMPRDALSPSLPPHPTQPAPAGSDPTAKTSHT